MINIVIQFYKSDSHNIIFFSYRILHYYNHRLIHSNRPRLFGTWCSTGSFRPCFNRSWRTTHDISKKQIESWNSWKFISDISLKCPKAYLNHGNPWDFPLKIWMPGTFEKGLCAWSYSVRWKWSHGWSQACDEAHGGLSRWNRILFLNSVVF